MTRFTNITLAALALFVLPASLGCSKAESPTTSDTAADNGGAAEEKPDMSGAEPTAVEQALAKLPEADRELVLAQGVCPVSGEDLGTMGTPIKVTVDGKDLFICCEACEEKAKANFDKYIAQIEEKTADEAQN